MRMIVRTRPVFALTSLALLALSTAVWAQDAGFSISQGQDLIAGDKAIAARSSLKSRHRAPITAGKLQLRADGLGVKPRLDLEVTVLASGIKLQSRMNYPVFVTRGELRLIDPATGRVLKTYVMAANSSLSLPPQKGLAATYRVYDAAGRFDETAALSLAATHAAKGEPGIDRAAIRHIPVTGGAVTLTAANLAPGAPVNAFGEVFAADASGGLAIQRILPSGTQLIAVQAAGTAGIRPVITIAKSEWFTVASADLTYGRVLSGSHKGDNYDAGRLAYYSKGKTASGWSVTSSADTGEQTLAEVFRDFDRKDPRGLIERLDPDLAYPVYGDDATLENDAPTSGKFYLKLEKDGSHLTWGNFKGELAGSQYIRNERALYGLQTTLRTAATTSNGEPRAALTLYGAQPENLPGREVFLGTGGSIYFLRRQDISTGSETLTVERRDPVTGRIIDQRALVAGRDYTINYIQGVIALSAPLNGLGASTGTVLGTNTPQTRLVAQYEFTPTAGDVSGYAMGGRAEVWASDQLRLGVTGMIEQTDLADQTARGADLRYNFGENSFVEAEIAATTGPGFGASFSPDGGLTTDTTAATGGTGQAYRLKTSLDLADLGLSTKGKLTGYAENRKAGFSTLDYQTAANESLWGWGLEAQATDKLSLKLAYDAFNSDAGKHLNTGAIDLTYQQNDRLSWDLGLTHEDRADPAAAAKTGQRSDLALRATFKASDALSYTIFGQTTLNHSATRLRNDRIGAGATLAFAQGWTLETALSTGTTGLGGKSLLSYEQGGNSAYFGYELDPSRELDGVTLNGRDAGRVVAGARQKLSDTTEVFGESSYDMFGRHRAMTSTYGVTYQPSKLLTFSASAELGHLDDPTAGLDRRALSFGLNYQDDTLSAKAKLELRQDRASAGSTAANTDALLISGHATYQINEAERWLASVDLADSQTDGASILSGQYAKATLGYAFRPTDSDRLNLLAKFTYLYDMYGQRLDGTDSVGARQRSQVLSIDATYDLNQHWEIGAKLGYRLAQSAPNATTPLAQNDASLAVINARYHLNFQWDALIEARYLQAHQAGVSDFGVVGTLYRHVGENMMLGLGYDFGAASDDLTDLREKDHGVFVNLVGKF